MVVRSGGGMTSMKSLHILQKNVWLWVVSIGLSQWMGLAAVMADGDPLSAPLNSWDSILKSAPFGLMTGLVVKWFMSYIEKKDIAFAATMAKKDEDFMLLVRECQSETRTYGQKILESMDRTTLAMQHLKAPPTV